MEFLDLGYIFPFGDLIELADWGMGRGKLSVGFLPPTGPYTAFLEALVFNKSLFTGKPITKETDTFAEKTAKIADYLGKALLTPVAPPIPGTGFRGGYSTEAARRALVPELQLPGEAPLSGTDHLGNPISPSRVAASKLAGLNVTRVNPSVAKGYKALEYRGKLHDLAREIASVHRKGLTPKQKDVEQSRIMDKILRLQREAQETLR
jgi:hypothetical protein